MDTLLMCGNCEKQDATHICEQCEGEDSYFCQKCWNIHTQVKAFRQHVATHSTNSVNATISSMPEIPSSAQFNLQQIKLEKGKTKNGPLSFDENSPKIISRGPLLSEQKACKNKSYMEGVKDAFLNISGSRPNYEAEFKAMLGKPDEQENVGQKEMQNESPKSPMSFLEYCDNLVEACSNVSDVGEMNTNTVVYGFVAALIVHIVTKILFGRISIFVVVCLGMALAALVRKRQSIISMEISKLQSTNSDCRTEMKAVSIGDPTQMNTINAKNDFWHADRQISSAGSGARLRPRGARPFNNYRGRSAQKQADAEVTEPNKKVD